MNNDDVSVCRSIVLFFCVYVMCVSVKKRSHASRSRGSKASSSSSKLKSTTGTSSDKSKDKDKVCLVQFSSVAFFLGFAYLICYFNVLDCLTD